MVKTFNEQMTKHMAQISQEWANNTKVNGIPIHEAIHKDMPGVLQHLGIEISEEEFERLRELIQHSSDENLGKKLEERKNKSSCPCP